MADSITPQKCSMQESKCQSAHKRSVESLRFRKTTSPGRLVGNRARIVVAYTASAAVKSSSTPDAPDTPPVGKALRLCADICDGKSENFLLVGCCFIVSPFAGKLIQRDPISQWYRQRYARLPNGSENYAITHVALVHRLSSSISSASIGVPGTCTQ